MFAVIKTGGKQYRVAPDDVLTIERLEGEAGGSVSFDQVLMIGDGETTTIGTPTVAGAQVAAEVVEQTRGPKIIILKKRRRKSSRRRQGHRQDLTTVRITEILTASGPLRARAAQPETAAETDVAAPTADVVPVAGGAPAADAAPGGAA
jgi:large subunit ribosomal protein L21